MTNPAFSKTIKLNVHTLSQFSLQEQNLLQAAINVRRNAQAPYSKFAVGVAVLSNKKTMHVGCNVERCSWTQTTHAEQNAIDSMIAQHGPSKIEVIAIAGGPLSTVLTMPDQNIIATPANACDAAMPCGHCRQIIWENCYQDSSVKILSLMPNGLVVETTIGDLLPMPFGPEQLGINYAAE